MCFFKKNIRSDFLFHPKFQMKDVHNQNINRLMKNIYQNNKWKVSYY